VLPAGALGASRQSRRRSVRSPPPRCRVAEAVAATACTTATRGATASRAPGGPAALVRHPQHVADETTAVARASSGSTQWRAGWRPHSCPRRTPGTESGRRSLQPLRPPPSGRGSSWCAPPLQCV